VCVLIIHVHEDGERSVGTTERSICQEPSAARVPSQVVVAANAAWFRVGSRSLVHLETRTALRKVLSALAELRVRKPLATLSANDAFAAGWPGERAHPNAAAVRVYTAIHTLRSLGLRGVLVRRDGGYALEAEVTIASNESQFPAAMSQDDDVLANAG
jgi:hypothetical protein